MYLHSKNPLIVNTFDGFGGLGYFQGMASNGHVNNFKVVSQLKDSMGFGLGFSNIMIQKIQALIIGIYFDKQQTTKDRGFMNIIHP